MSVNIGHGDQRVIEAITDQADKLAYANPFMATEPRARLGAKLAELTPGDIDVFFFTNGGAEANENAIKLARQFTGRQKIMARYRSYHGATGQAIVATGDPRRWAAETGVVGRRALPRLPPLGPQGPGAGRARACATWRRRSCSRARTRSPRILAGDGRGHQRHPHPARRLHRRASARCATSTAS